MAHIHIDQLKDQERIFYFEEKPQSFPALSNMINNKECAFLAPVKTHLRATRLGDLVEVEGRIETMLRLPCSRCLNDFDHHLRSEFALTYTRELPEAVAQLSDTEIELRFEDMELVYFSGDRIDLQPDIAEQVILALPLKPLCSATCQGLCPTCGVDLNKAKCLCDQTPFSNKFAALRNLKLVKK